MIAWSVILGGQSSSDHGHVEPLKKILGEILVYHTQGCQSSFDHAHAESLKKILGESLVMIQHVHGQKMIDSPIMIGQDVT